MKQPIGFNSNDGKVCLLLKSIYGLKQASKMWNERVHCLLIDNGFDVTHWQAAKRILRYLAGTMDLGLLFVSNNNLNLYLSAFTDADWANDVTDRKSYTGFIVKLGKNIINWESRKQRCVALSSHRQKQNT